MGRLGGGFADLPLKFFIGAILGCEVLSLVPTTQEHTEPDDNLPKVTLFRMDFAATILTKEEGEKRVIIEMQKTKLLDDVFRFRKYLGKEYTVSKLLKYGEKMPASKIAKITGLQEAEIEKL
jgi:hypothetical protein